MRAVVLLAMLMFVLRGCTSDSSDNFSRRPEPAQSDVGAPHGNAADPFVEGSSYRFVIKASEITPGLEHSNAVVRISISDFVGGYTEEIDTDSEPADTDSETSTEDEAGTDREISNADDSVALATGSKVRLDWICGEQEERGHKEVEMNRLDVTLKITFRELPALKRASDSIPCEVEATLNTTTANGDRVIATGSREFYIEMDVLRPALQLHDLTVVEDESNPATSILKFKVALIRQGKVVEKGDTIFDNEVEVTLHWRCNDAPEEENRSKSAVPTYMTIATGLGEANTQLNIPNRPDIGEAGYACMIDASSEIDGYDDAVEGEKKLWIEGKDLQVAVTAVSSTSLSYAVMARYQAVSGNVKLSIEGCTGVTFSSSNTTEVENIISSGDVTLGGTGGEGCVLKAEVMDSDDTNPNPLRVGKSQAFTVPAPVPVPSAFK